MKKTVSVIGIGRVGLPMALVLADEGFKVHGIGRDQRKIDSIKNGCWVNSRGLNNNDKLELRRIINEKYKYK